MQGLPSGCKPAIGSDGKPIQGFAVRDDGVVFYWREQWTKWIPLKVKTGPSGFRKVALGPRGTRETGVALLVLLRLRWLAADRLRTTALPRSGPWQQSP